MARERGWTEVEFEGDSSQLMEEMGKGIIDPFSNYGHLGACIIELLCTFSFSSSSFVKRTSNRLAHALAHLDCFSSDTLENSMLPADLASLI